MKQTNVNYSYAEFIEMQRTSVKYFTLGEGLTFYNFTLNIPFSPAFLRDEGVTQNKNFSYKKWIF